MAEQLDSELMDGDGQAGKAFWLELSSWAARFLTPRFPFSCRGKEEDLCGFLGGNLRKETGSVYKDTLPGLELELMIYWPFDDWSSNREKERGVQVKEEKGNSTQCRLSRIPAESLPSCCHCPLDLEEKVQWSVKHCTLQQNKTRDSRGRWSGTWRSSGVGDAPAGVLPLDLLLGLHQLHLMFAISPPQILHVSHHELDCTAHSSLLSKTGRRHFKIHLHSKIYFGFDLRHRNKNCIFKMSLSA